MYPFSCVIKESCQVRSVLGFISLSFIFLKYGRTLSCDDYDTEQKLKEKDSARVGRDLAFLTKILVDTILALDDKVCREMTELKPDKSDGASALNAVNKILTDSTYKRNAEKIAEGFKNSLGAKGAADKIIDICNGMI